MTVDSEQSLRAVIGDLIKQHAPGRAIEFARRRGPRNIEVIVASVALEQATVRLAVPVDQPCERNGGMLGGLIEARLREAHAQQGQLAQRIADIGGVLASAVGEGTGMRLRSIGMEPILVSARLRWWNLRIEAAIDMLNERLQPETVRIAGTVKADFETDLRCNAPIQRRRATRLAFLARHDAVAEIDAFAEALLVSHGFALSEVLERFKSGEPIIALSGTATAGSGAWLELHMPNGCIRAVGCIPPCEPTTVLNGNVLRVDGRMSAAQCSSLIGRSPRALLDSPELPAGARVIEARSYDRYTEVTMNIPRRFLTSNDLR